MKRFILIPAAIIAALSSCTPSADIPEERTSLTVSIAPAGTKATNISADNEVRVESLQILVFRDDELDAYGNAGSDLEITLSCTAGDRTVYALVNGPDVSGSSTKTEFLATLHSLDDNALNAFIMTGSVRVTLPAANTVHIEVNRVVARIDLQDLQRQFTAPALKTLGFNVTRIYLDNVVGGNDIGMSLPCDSFGNEGQYNGDWATFTCDAVGAEIADGSTLGQAHVFYAYPNDNSVKETRLVVEAVQNSKTYYYHVVLPALESNHRYVIPKLTVTRLGSEDPDTPVQITDQPFEIEIMPWTVVPVDSAVI